MNTNIFREFAEKLKMTLHLEGPFVAQSMKNVARETFSPAYDLLEEAQESAAFAMKVSFERRDDKNYQKYKAIFTRLVLFNDALLSQKGDDIPAEFVKGCADIDAGRTKPIPDSFDSTPQVAEGKCGRCDGSGFEPSRSDDGGGMVNPCAECQGSGTIPAAQKNGEEK